MNSPGLRFGLLSCLLALCGCGDDAAIEGGSNEPPPENTPPGDPPKEDPTPAGPCAARFGTLAHERVTDLATDPSGNVYIAGAYDGDLDFGGGALASPRMVVRHFVAKLDAQCKHVWSKSFIKPDRVDY